ncbi:MAG TPA: hypothetical protein VFZ00_05395 [Solirubrobacter sp.]|nr:hypothetical protein [Solirubrobacter sp.]
MNTPFTRTIGNGDSIRGAGETGGGVVAGAVETSNPGAVVAGTAGALAAAGATVGVGVGVAVGVGVGVGSGAAMTCAVAAERFSCAPSEFATLSRTRRTNPTSAEVTAYVCSVAPSITAHFPVGRTQRSHRQVATGAGSPSHWAFAARSEPACGVPSIAGPAMIFGALAARAPQGRARSTPTTTSAAATHARGAVRPPSISIAILRRSVGAINTGPWPDG